MISSRKTLKYRSVFIRTLPAASKQFNLQRIQDRDILSLHIESARTAAALEQRRQRFQQERQLKIINAPHNPNYQHWLVHSTPRTPQRIIDSKCRLGQAKASPSAEQQKNNPRSAASRVSHAQTADDQRHILDFNLPDTPDELRAARHRIEKNRYHPSLDNYPARSQTCPVPTAELFEPLPPLVAAPSEPIAAYDDPSIDHERSYVFESESPRCVVQTLDIEGLPVEYIEAVETANAAQEEYEKELQKHTNRLTFRLPALSVDQRNYSSVSSIDSIVTRKTLPRESRGISKHHRRIHRAATLPFSNFIHQKNRLTARQLVRHPRHDN